jgi:hypothetical protein
MLAGFEGFRGFGVATEEFAPGGAVVVKAFGGGVEDEGDALAVVAIEAAVVEEVGEGGCVV